MTTDRRGRRAAPALVDLGADPGQARLLAELYHEVLAPAFPPDELVSLPALEGAVLGGGEGVEVVVAVDSGGGAPRVVGGIVGERYPGSNVLLLAYLAVRPELRGAGVGTLLLAEVIPLWCRRHRPLLAVGEVEHPDHHGPSPERGDPAARLRLYERVGARVLAAPYFQPRIGPDLQRVYDMLLLAFEVDPRAYRGDPAGDHGGAATVDGKVVTGFLDEYFTVCEGGDTITTDPDFRSMRAAMDPAGGLGLLPVSRYREVPRLRRA